MTVAIGLKSWACPHPADLGSVTMSTGKRLAKRSILGTRIVAPGMDGRFYPAVITSHIRVESPRCENRYTVRFDNSRKVTEVLETDLIGPGFGGLARGVELLQGQRVYITHLGQENREVWVFKGAGVPTGIPYLDQELRNAFWHIY